MTTSTHHNSTPVPNVKKFQIQKRLLRNNISDVLLRFKFSHLTSDTIANIFELNPEEINNKLNKFKLLFNKHSVADLLTVRCKDFNLEELQDINNSLLLYRAAFFSKMKKWTPIHLLEPEETLQWKVDLKEIRINILQSFRIKSLNAIVKVIEHEGMMWLMVIEKKLTRRKGVRLLTPVYFCYEPGTPYLFKSSSVPNVVIECLLRALQFKKHKLHHLEGRDVKSLLAVLKHRATHANNSQLVEYTPAEFDIGHRVTDYSKRKARISYADKLFNTTEPIQLETFTVNVDAPWYKNDLVPEMKGEVFKATLELKSRNLIEMIKYTVANDIVATPLPEYVKTILRSGKNKVRITASARQTDRRT